MCKLNVHLSCGISNCFECKCVSVATASAATCLLCEAFGLYKVYLLQACLPQHLQGSCCRFLTITTMPMTHTHIFQKLQAMLAAAATATPLKAMVILLHQKAIEPTKKYSTSGFWNSGSATCIKSSRSIFATNGTAAMAVSQ